MKKTSFLFLLALLSLAASAEVVKVGGLWYNLIYHPQGDYTTAEVVASQDDPYSGWQTIPEKIYYGEDCAVTSIGESAFEGCDGITYLAIPSSITHIGEYAFRDCGSNMEVQIVDLAAWCKVEFGNEHSSPLSSAKKFYLKDSGAYGYKHEVKSLYIPNGVESISSFAFYQCRSITSLIIPGSVKSIGSSAFEDCTGLSSIYLSEGVESIGGSSFEGCIGISSLVLPSSLTSIALNAFKNCNNLNTIVSRIQEPFAFVDNVFSTYSTATVIVPEGTMTAYLSTSGWNLFENITDDSSQAPAKRTIHVTTAGTLPNLVSGDEFYIEELVLTGELNGTDVRFLRAMSGIDYLIRENRQDSSEPYYVTSVATPGNLKVLDITGTKIVEGGERYYIPSEYYNGNLSHRYGYNTVSNTISDYMFNGCKLTSVGLPNSVESIGNNAFCSSMTSISVPASVTSISSGAFNGTAWYNSQPDGLVYAGKVAYIYKGEMPSNTHINIKDGTLVINNSVFSNCSNLTSITLPNSLTKVGDYAFYRCSGLTSIDIPNNVTSIGMYAFQNCIGLTCIDIPNNVTSIGADAFWGCSGLTTIVSEIEKPFEIGTNVFYSSNKDIYSTATLIVPSGKKTAYQMTEGWKMFTNIVEVGEGGVIGQVFEADGIYYRIGENKTVSIKSGKTKVGDVVIPSQVTFNGNVYSVTSIEMSAFDNCRGMTSVTIPSSITFIGYEAFCDCTSLTAVHITDLEAWCSIEFNLRESNPLYWAHQLFLNGIEITDLKVPNNVTTISGYSFLRCYNFTSVTIPNSVASISSNAFENCSGLTSITVESGNQYYDSRNNCNAIIEKATNTLIKGCKNSFIPNSVTSIGGAAFYGCSGLTSIIIPNCVTSIGSSAFFGCSGLKSIIIPNSVTSIGSSAFYQCSGLTTVVSKIENPFEIGNYVFYSSNKDIYSTVTLYVPAGKKAAYDATEGWNKFTNIKEFVDGDVNLDEKVNRIDQNALVAHIMGEKPEGFYEGLADLNGDDDVNAADVVKLIDVIGSKGLSTETEFGYDNVGGSLVVLSLTCTLNNERDEAILLTRCELYSNGSLLRTKSYSSNPVSVAAGGNKSCTFENLSKPANSTDFTVCWHYTVNGESFVYRCPLTD